MTTKRKKSDLRALAAHLDIEVSFLQECVECGALSPDSAAADPRAAAPAELARLRRLQRLCRGLELEPFAAVIIVELLERLDALEREVLRARR